ncbi:DUF523 and DUF1722 domain-containing protein [candidate division KSB1 bacterium]|nr:DUF523 and DUF1722 domain-containing protein [candidate division KSB1 bacterium]
MPTPADKQETGRDFPTPRIVVSKCMGFASCRYNGLTIHSDVVNRLGARSGVYVEFLPVCPEVAIGLGIPRDPIRIVKLGDELRLIQPSTKSDFSVQMTEFAAAHLSSLSDIDGSILKNRSPSCGINDVKIFPDPGSRIPVGKGAGFFGAKVLEMYPHLPVEDEGRLTNSRIREHFFIRIFTNAFFRRVKAGASMKHLVDFQRRNKLLLMAYNQKEMRLMGKIIANQEKRPLHQVIENYEQHLVSAFARPARVMSNINVLMHALGYFSKQLSHQEKAFFLDTLEAYRNNKAPLSVPNALLKSWMVRFNEPYLMQQTFFEPFPPGLIEISDSGKARDY